MPRKKSNKQSQTSQADARLLIGTSGWVYKHWMNGVFYPPKFPPNQQLLFYAERYPTVEVNFSFYKLPERSVFETWEEQSPDGFIFAVKASRYLTHMKKLKDPEEPLTRLMDRASGLKKKLGPILFQFPRTWPVHTERLEPFLQALKTYRRERFAFEFRHESWLNPQVYEMLEQAGAALCIPIGPGVPLDIRLTAPWSYIRFHSGQWGIGYTDEELRFWAERIQGFLDQKADVYAYFNNDLEGHALRDSVRLRDMLNA